MQENLNQNKGIECGHDAREHEIEKEGIESRSNARELDTKLRDRIRARYRRTRNKRKGLNLGTMLENPERREGIESGHDDREPE